MKSLVVFYSRTGTTRKVAEDIAEALNADTEEIIPERDRKGVMGYLVSGKEATQKKAAEIKKTEKDPSKYGLVVIGTPIWGWNLSSPVRAYIQQNKSKINKAAFFCTMGGSGDRTAFEDMRKEVKKPVATMSLKTKEVADDSYKDDVKEFVRKLK
ncbi:hypothetical protein GF345_06720 [Candidatus Woesearchaeota archaeon]|nr:hypothetical protein [Candidatus Woesearchaeota archaeon]